MVWIQIKTDIMSVLIWVQTVCKGVSADDKKMPQTQEKILERLPTIE